MTTESLATMHNEALALPEAVTEAAPLPDAPPAPRAAPRTISASSYITVEHLCYALLAVVALITRLFALGSRFYAPAEAATTWPAWLEAMSLPVAGAPQPSSALLHSLQVALFWLFDGGGSDVAGNFLGRLPVALASVIIVLLPFWWRNVLGRPAALALALLFALDPWLIALGRTADAAALSAACALATLTALHVAFTHRPILQPTGTAASLAAISLGLLVASGVQAWPWLIIVAAYILIVAPAGYAALASLRNILLFLAALILGATTLLAQPDALQIVSRSLAIFVERFGGSDYSLGWAFLRLITDAPLIFFVGILGVILAWRNPIADVRLRLFATLWLVLGLVLLILPGRTPYDLLLLGAPLAIFTAITIGKLVESIAIAFLLEDWIDALLLALVLSLLAVALLFWSTGAIWSREGASTTLLITLLLVALGIVLVAVFAWLVSARQALIVTLVVTIGVLAALGVASAVRLSTPERPSRPTGFFVENAYPGLRHLITDVRTLSDRRKGDDRELPVLVINDATRTPDPLLGWTLRSMRNLRFIDSWQVVATYADQTPPLVITPGEDTAVSQWNQFYLGSPYRTTVRWTPDALPTLAGRPEGSSTWSDLVRPWLRWLHMREAPPGAVDQVNLWATRGD